MMHPNLTSSFWWFSETYLSKIPTFVMNTDNSSSATISEYDIQAAAEKIFGSTQAFSLLPRNTPATDTVLALSSSSASTSPSEAPAPLYRFNASPATAEEERGAGGISSGLADLGTLKSKAACRAVIKCVDDFFANSDVGLAPSLSRFVRATWIDTLNYEFAHNPLDDTPRADSALRLFAIPFNLIWRITRTFISTICLPLSMGFEAAKCAIYGIEDPARHGLGWRKAVRHFANNWEETAQVVRAFGVSFIHIFSPGAFSETAAQQLFRYINRQHLDMRGEQIESTFITSRNKQLKREQQNKAEAESAGTNAVQRASPFSSSL